MKKTSKYIILTLLLLLGIFCIGIMYLFFLPGSSIFNITYINKHNIYKSLEYESTGVYKVELNSRAYEVNIVETKSSNISLDVHSNSFGFVLKKNKDVAISSTLRSGVVTFNIAEPHGFATSNNSVINLYIPEDLEFDLNLANTKATTNVNLNTSKIKNLNYSTQKGNFKFISGSITGTLDLNVGNSIFKIEENVKTNKNNVSLKLSTGRFIAESSSLGHVSINANERGVIIIKNCQTLEENIKSAGGQISIETVSNVNISTSDTIIKINTVTDGATIDLTDSGNISIDDLSGITVLTTNSGNINLGATHSTTVLKSNSGNIYVGLADRSVDVTSHSGSVSVNFNTELDYSHLLNARSLTAKIGNGSLVATGVQHLGTIDEEEGINIYGKGHVTVYMDDVRGQNSVTGNTGNVHIVVNHDSKYILSTQSSTGNVRVNLCQISEYGGYTYKHFVSKNINCSSSDNSLFVTTTSGNLTIVDTKLS